MATDDAQATAAKPVDEKADNGWSGEGALGYTATSGNTDSDSLNAKLGMVREHGKWKHAAGIETLKATTDHVASADSMMFKEKSEYKFGENSYAFGKLRYEEDEFSGFEYQASLSFGLGSRFLSSAHHSLDASLGLGRRSSKDTATLQTTEENIVVADAAYKYIISDSATFSEQVSIESGKENTHSESETSLLTKINSHLASKISYLVKHNSDVPSPTEKTDKVLTVSLVYSF